MNIKNYAKNFLLTKLTYVINKCSKKNSWNPQKPKVLFISTTALGDSLWATPAIRTFKNAYPESEVLCLTSNTGKQIFQGNPAISKIFIYEKRNFFSLWKNLLKEKVQIVFILHASQRLSFCLPHLIKAEHVHTRGKNEKINLKNLCSFVSYENESHEILARLALFDPLNIPHITQMEYFLLKEEIDEAKKRLPKNQICICIHPGSQDPFRAYLLHGYIATAKLLKEKYDACIILTGTKKEKPYIEKIQKEVEAISFTNLSIRQFIATLSLIDLIITNDTGAQHIGYAQKTPTIAIYCPTSSKRYGPLDIENSAIVYKERPCKTCLKRDCKTSFCMLQISPDEIFKKAEIFLADKDS
ncbi:MAG TPA: glycosyltransferase family 9 protein [Chlamydiales bacterium]|nr:glycosyltransferase family 9 protein [Chlamydiales bacterium]